MILKGIDWVRKRQLVPKGTTTATFNSLPLNVSQGRREERSGHLGRLHAEVPVILGRADRGDGEIHAADERQETGPVVPEHAPASGGQARESRGHLPALQLALTSRVESADAGARHPSQDRRASLIMKTPRRYIGGSPPCDPCIAAKHGNGDAARRTG